jgi:hypothetical protein
VPLPGARRKAPTAGAGGRFGGTMRAMPTLDRLRGRAFRLLDRTAAGRRLNDALGRPLAPEDELADRRAFARGYQAPAPAPAASPSEVGPSDAAPVVIFTLDKHRRDADRLAQILDDAEVSYAVRSLEDDPAGQAAVRRDARGLGLPVVVIAGEVIGGRAELTNLGRAGIRQRVRG